MKHGLIVKPSEQIDLGVFQPQIITPLIRHMVDRALSGVTDTFVFEGRPGVGKTALARELALQLTLRGIPNFTVAMEDEVLARDERKGKSILEHHLGELIKEVLRARDLGGVVQYDRYNTETGSRDILERKLVLPASEGVMIVEGIRAIEAVREYVSGLNSWVEDRIQYILLDESVELSNYRRLIRDIMEKGLPIEMVQKRIQDQASCIDYHAMQTNKGLISMTAGRPRTDAILIG